MGRPEGRRDLVVVLFQESFPLVGTVLSTFVVEILGDHDGVETTTAETTGQPGKVPVKEGV